MFRRVHWVPGARFTRNPEREHCRERETYHINSCCSSRGMGRLNASDGSGRRRAGMQGIDQAMREVARVRSSLGGAATALFL